MKIVITGATGFIGSYVAVRLARAGHTVVATGRNPRKVPALGDVPGITLARLELHDPASWAPALAGADVLVHVALGWGEGGLLMLQADTAASVGLFEAAHAAGVRRIIYTSSTAAVGEQQGDDREDIQLRPTD
jgi:UDP-glucose 4-epimerase